MNVFLFRIVFAAVFWIRVKDMDFAVGKPRFVPGRRMLLEDVQQTIFKAVDAPRTDRVNETVRVLHEAMGVAGPFRTIAATSDAAKVGTSKHGIDINKEPQRPVARPGIGSSGPHVDGLPLRKIFME